MIFQRKLYTRKQKTVIRASLALVLMALMFFLVYTHRVHTPEQALRAAEHRCGAMETEVIAQHKYDGGIFYLSRNEYSLLLVRFEPWMQPEDTLMEALDLTKENPYAPLVASRNTYFDTAKERAYDMIFGSFDLDGVAAVRGDSSRSPTHTDGAIISTEDGKQFFWVCQEIDDFWQWNKHGLPYMDRLDFLDQSGISVYSISEIDPLFFLS